MIPNHFYTWVYDPETSHCAHYAVAVWNHLTGEDIEPYMLASLSPLNEAKVDWQARKIFKRVSKPIEPSLVTMRIPGSELHVGVYLDGCVLQLTSDGVTCFPLDVIPGVKRFYAPVETRNE